MKTLPLPSIFDDSPQVLIEHAKRMPKLMQSDYSEGLGQHVDNISNEWVPGIGASFDGNDGDSFYRYSLKRVHAQQCTFRNCSFERAAGTGSVWKDCQFENCDFTDSNFQFADFSGSKFAPTASNSNFQKDWNIVKGGGFSGVSFVDTVFDGTTVVGCNFSQSDFSNSRISSCNITSSTFEGAVFHRASVTNTDLNNVNIEYADFMGAKLQQVYFSLLQFPFVFGLEPQAFQSGQVLISTIDEKQYPDKRIPWEALLELIPDLVSYYEERAVFFPIANLYLLSGQYDLAKEYLGLGVKVALEMTSYRDLKHLCKLARISNCFHSDELLALYHLIEQRREDTLGQSRRGDLSYQSHAGEIRHFLTFPKTKTDSFSIHIKLKDQGENSHNLAKTRFVEDFSSFLHSFGVDLSWNGLEYVEQSPPVIQIVGNQNSVTVNEYAPQQLRMLEQQHAKVLARLEELESLQEQDCEPSKDDKAALPVKAFRWQKAVAILIAANFLMSHGDKIGEIATDLYHSIDPPDAAVEIKERIQDYTDVEMITLVFDGKIIAKTINGQLVSTDERLKLVTDTLQGI